MHTGSSNGALARQLRNTTAIASVNGVASAQTGVSGDNRVIGSPQCNGGAAVVDVSLKKSARFLLQEVRSKNGYTIG